MKIGDRITFTVTTRDGRRKATRKVVGFHGNGCPQVRYSGYADFAVGWLPSDIIHSVEEGAS